MFDQRLMHAATVVAALVTCCPNALGQSVEEGPTKSPAGGGSAVALPTVDVIAAKKRKPKRPAAAKQSKPSASPVSQAAVSDAFPEGELPVPTVAGPFSEQQRAAYSSTGSTSYISSEALSRFSGTSPADFLRGQAGVQIGETRNGGGIDANIRGMQGQRRISVTVDGAENTIDTYRGYGGSQQRSYIDPDLLGGVTISKGPSSSQGAIGGTIAATTLTPDDVLKEGRSFGFRVKGNIASNSTAEPTEFRPTPETDSTSLFDPQAGNGSVAFAVRQQHFDIVAAYAARDQGNYFAGKKGRKDYRSFITFDCCPDFRLEAETVGKHYREGEEVLNSSVETNSLLLKTILRPAKGHALELAYRTFDSEMGEIMPSQIVRNQGNTIPQWRPGLYETETYTSRYSWQPENNPLIDFRLSGSFNDFYSDAFNNPWLEAPRPPGVPLDENSFPGYQYAYGAKMQTQRYSFDADNTSRFKTPLGALAVQFGAAYTLEDLSPAPNAYKATLDDLQNNRFFRSAVREEVNAFGNLTWKPVDPLTFEAGLRYTRFDLRDRNRKAVRANFGPFLYFEDPIQRDDDGFAPTFSAAFEPWKGTKLYAKHAQGLRMPGIFESTRGYIAGVPSGPLEPELAKNWEFGASSLLNSVAKQGDALMLKAAYFNNKTENFISRHANIVAIPMTLNFENNDAFYVRGVEVQGAYDAGFFFADAALTYTIEAVTCNAARAEFYRNDPYGFANVRNTPNCVDGGFAGEFTNTQNPPKVSLAATLGVRLLDERLTIGGRVIHNSQPVAKLDKPYTGYQPINNTGLAYQKHYGETRPIVDLFSSYKFDNESEFTFGIDNATNQYYIDPLTISFMPAPGRTVKAGWTTKF